MWSLDQIHESTVGWPATALALAIMKRIFALLHRQRVALSGPRLHFDGNSEQ
jgi:hypothetical protein